MDDAAKRALLVGLAAGLLIGTVGIPGAEDALDARADDGEPGFTTVAQSGPSCHDGALNSADGWMHVVANGESWSVSANATVVHPPGTEVDVEVSQRTQHRYEIALSAVDAADERARPDRDCRRRTRLRLGTGLSEPRFEVTANGRTVRSVDQESTSGRLYRLPNPIELEE